MHVIRLLNEGIELMRSGVITLPRPEKDLLVTIRTGNYGSLDRVLSLANALFLDLEQSRTESALPEDVDRARISKQVSDTYLEHWGGTQRSRIDAHELEILNRATSRLNAEVEEVLKDQADL
jgi:hypothetical protein